MSRLGWTTTRIQTTLRSVGLGYRRTDMLADIRTYKGVERARDPLRAVPRKFLPSDNLINQTELNLRRRYRVTYHVDYMDPETGFTETKYSSLSTSHLRSIEEMEDRMRDVIEDEEGPTNLQVVSIQIDSIMQRSGTGRSTTQPTAPWD